MPTVWYWPAATEANAVPTRTGKCLCTVDPSPIWPDQLQPDTQSVPSVLTAAVCREPAAIEAKPLPTWAGEFRWLDAPSPSWPWLLDPHAQRTPSTFTARL